MELLKSLYNDDNLCKWFKYAYNERSKASIHKASSIEDMINHFHMSGYNDSKILEITKAAHGVDELVPQLVCI